MDFIISSTSTVSFRRFDCIWVSAIDRFCSASEPMLVQWCTAISAAMPATGASTTGPPLIHSRVNTISRNGTSTATPVTSWGTSCVMLSRLRSRSEMAPAERGASVILASSSFRIADAWIAALAELDSESWILEANPPDRDLPTRPASRRSKSPKACQSRNAE